MSKGSIEFYQKNKDKLSRIAESQYITKSSLIGAVYSDTLETYECNMQNAFSRLNLVTKIYVDRTDKAMGFIKERDGNVQCLSYYENAKNHMNII